MPENVAQPVAELVADLRNSLVRCLALRAGIELPYSTSVIAALAGPRM